MNEDDRKPPRDTRRADDDRRLPPPRPKPCDETGYQRAGTERRINPAFITAFGRPPKRSKSR